MDKEKLQDTFLNIFEKFTGPILALFGTLVITIGSLVYYFFISNGNAQVSTDPNAVVTDTIKCSTFKFEFDNHKYVKFKTDKNEHIIHDPACKCIANKLNNITTVIVNNDNKHSKEVDAKLTKMEAQVKNFSVELEKKPKVIYVTKQAPSKPTATMKKTVVPNKPAPHKPAPKKR